MPLLWLECTAVLWLQKMPRVGVSLHDCTCDSTFKVGHGPLPVACFQMQPVAAGRQCHDGMEGFMVQSADAHGRCHNHR